MSWLLNLIIDLWCSLWRIHREVNETSLVGQSEFEKEGPGVLLSIIGLGILAVVAFFYFRG